jgi:pyrroline-5-carboxylate reductase
MANHLAAECYCNIAESNQQVVDQCDIILLAVRPAHLDELLQTINFRPGQTVISVMAGVSLKQLRQYPELQQTELVRALPSTSAEVNAGPIPLFPSNPIAEALFASLGQVVTLTSESLFETALAHACLHGWSYFLVQALIDWSIEQGMDPITARQMVAHSISSSITFAEANPTLSYQEIGDSIATEGTFTRKGIQQIKSDNGIQSWIDAMESIK